jgi:hypothetical protein
MLPTTHFLDDEKGAEAEKIGLATTCRSRGADVAVDVKPGAEYR